MNRHVFCGALALFLIATVGPVFGQQAEPDAPQLEETELTAEEKAVVEQGLLFRDEVVVTAGRREQLSGETTAPITVLTREEIEREQPEKMADLFKRIPGVEIQGEGPFRGIPVIRGLTSNRVLILVDGQRLNNARESTDFAGIQPALVNLADVERIEVLRGPASVQYGSDAIGGVVNIITRKPDLGSQDFKISGDAAYEYASTSDSQQLRASVSGAGRGFSFFAGATVEDVGNYTAADGASEDPRYEDYVLADNVVPNSGMEQTTFNGNLRFLTGKQGVFRVNAEVVRTENVGFPGFDPETSGIDISFPVFDRDKLALAWESGPVWGLNTIVLSTWYQEIDKESIRNLDFGFFFANQYTQSLIKSTGFNAQSIADLDAHHLSFGLDFYQDRLHDNALSESTFSPPNDDVVVPDSHQRGLGLYIEDQITLSQRFTLNAGLRGDDFSFVTEDDPRYQGEQFDVDQTALAGNLGVVWQVAEHVNLTALIARGFRAPNLQERSFTGLASTGDTFILQNPFLDSETSWNYEAGFKLRYDRYSGGLHFFYNDLNNFITLEFLDPAESPIPGLDAAQLQNVEKATIKGIELDLEAIFARWWTAFGSFALIEGDNNITNEPLPSIPPMKVILGLRYQRVSWWAEADMRWLDSQTRLPTDDPRFETGTPGFTVFALRGGYDFDFGLGVLVALENLTDKLYNEPYNNRPEPGRNLRMTVAYRF
jgi:hemoglobin/transferrin/lactoferrin receptor protein